VELRHEPTVVLVHHCLIAVVVIVVAVDMPFAAPHKE
jgi:hypothetical protein